MESFSSELSRNNFQIGFFDPPYNTKHRIIDNCDLKVMYASYESGSKINLWCETSADQQTSGVETEPSAKRKRTLLARALWMRQTQSSRSLRENIQIRAVL